MSNARGIAMEHVALVLNVPPPWDLLTAKQLVYLSHILAGASYLEIAAHYQISEAAVRMAMYRVGQMMQCRPRHVERMAAEDGVPKLPLPVASDALRA